MLVRTCWVPTLPRHLFPEQPQGGRTFWNGSKIFVLVRGGIAVHEVGVFMGQAGKGRAVRPGAAGELGAR